MDERRKDTEIIARECEDWLDTHTWHLQQCAYREALRRAYMAGYSRGDIDGYLDGTGYGKEEAL